MCLDTRFTSIGILIIPGHMVKIAHGIDLGKGSIDGMTLWIGLLGVLSKGWAGFLAVKVEVSIGYGSGSMEEEVPIDCLTILVEATLSVYGPNCKKQYQHLHHLINVILKIILSGWMISIAHFLLVIAIWHQWKCQEAFLFFGRSGRRWYIGFLRNRTFLPSSESWIILLNFPLYYCIERWPCFNQRDYL